MFNEIALTAGVCLAASVGFVTAVFVAARSKKRYDLIDSAWGVGFVLAALISWLLGTRELRTVLVTLLVSLWGIRLARHIFRRFRSHHTEDWRYAQMRQRWGSQADSNAFIRVFILQAVLITIGVLPVIIINTVSGPGLNWLDITGLAVWVVGFYFESIGDRQLAAFLKNPVNKGKLMTSGLWKYTRHPNYFGESAQWWGIYLIALSVPYGWAGIVGPILITVLVTRVSGVPLLEKSYAGRPDWEAYKARTSIFIPLPPKR